MNISGSGNIAGGEYNEKIHISGSARLGGNVRCEELHCSGSTRAQGFLKCEKDLRVSGSCTVAGEVEADVIRVSGSFGADGDVRAKTELSISGSVKCGGNIKGGELVCSGAVSTEGDMEGERIKIAGRINCKGLVNAEKIEIVLDGSSGGTVGSMGGSEIIVRKRDKNNAHVITRLPLLSKIFGGSTEQLSVSELVEGDTVALEYVSAPKVVGRVVAIGKGCHVGLVQYSEELEIDPDAVVENSEKV